MLKEGITTLACDLGRSEKKTDNHMDMQFLFWPQESHFAFRCECCQAAVLSKAQWSMGEHHPVKEHSTEFEQDFLCSWKFMNSFFLGPEQLILFNPRRFIFYKQMVWALYGVSSVVKWVFEVWKLALSESTSQFENPCSWQPDSYPEKTFSQFICWS